MTSPIRENPPKSGGPQRSAGAKAAEQADFTDEDLAIVDRVWDRLGRAEPSAPTDPKDMGAKP